MASLKDIIQQLEYHARKNMIDIHHQLNAWLDYMIELFDIEQYRTPHGWHIMQKEKCNESRELFSATCIWMNMVADSMGKGETLDVLGSVYEELFQSKMKSSNLGQFFTPTSVCDLLSKIVLTERDGRINDPSCGSGRTLISHYMESLRHGACNGYYVGEDIDVVSVKMCALNMMVYGIRGRVIRHDTITQPYSFDYGYEVNEVRHPFTTPYYSLRRINGSPSMPTPSKEQDGQYSLF